MMAVLEFATTYDTPIFTLKLRNSALKDAYGAMYHGKTQAWWFPAFYPVHQYVVSDLKKLVPGLQLSKEAQAHLATLDAEPALPASYTYLTPPYAHQEEGVKHIYRNLRAGLFYDPGLGKCKVTVDFQRLTNIPLLIVCPRIMLSTWAEEFIKHGNITDVLVIDGSTKAKKLAQIDKAIERAPAAVVLTYGVASLYYEQIAKIAYKGFIVDESHRIKQPFAKRTQALGHLAQRAHRRVLLSGTPSLGSPFDMYGQLRLLGKYFCPENWWAFRKKFGVFAPHEQDAAVPKILLGYQKMDIINSRVNLICLRKTRAECLDLPDRVIIDTPIGLYPSQKKLYNTLITDRAFGAGESIKQGIIEGTINHASGPVLPEHVIIRETVTLLSKLDQVSSGFLYTTQTNPALCDGCEHMASCSKDNIRPYTRNCTVVQKEPFSPTHHTADNARLEQCLDLLEDLLANENNKVIIWATYQQELDDLRYALKSADIPFVSVQGGLSQEAVTRSVATFNNDAKTRVYLGQVSTGIGITLNSANYTIYYSLPWSLEHYIQSLDRNYRIGQGNKVTVYRLIARHTLDEAKVAALEQKIDFATLVSAKAVCATCPDYFTRCSKYNIVLYDKECKYDRKMHRSTAVVRLIP